MYLLEMYANVGDRSLFQTKMCIEKVEQGEEVLSSAFLISFMDSHQAESGDPP